MKKLFTLFGLTAAMLVGGVQQANAWKSVYLVSSENSWTDYNQTTNAFNKTDGNNFDIYIPARLVTSNSFYFRFLVYADDNSQNLIAPSAKGDIISTIDYSNTVNINSYDDKDYSFQIAATPSATGGMKISISYNESTGAGDWKWHVTAETITETTTLGFVKPAGWTGVKVHSWDDISKIRYTSEAFPGDVITEENGIYTVTVDKGNTPKIIFSNLANSSEKTGDLAIVDGAIYNADGLKENVPISITSVGYSTFSSEYPVDFSTLSSSVRAYRATVNASDRVVLTKITEAPANTGLLLKSISGEAINTNVPTKVVTASVGDNLLKACVAGGTISASDNENNIFHYFLAGTTASNIGFYNLADPADCAAGKAYLETTTALASDPASSRVGWIFEDEATGVESVKAATQNNEVYNLRGQRVANPTKGLYIVNGKKVIMK